jgi:SNF2 family DNA or RNA helicase
LIIDEVQNYTNVDSNRCKCLASICSKFRWGLSGTMFNEPKMERILGYYLIINHPTFPRNVPDALIHVGSIDFMGTSETTVYRSENVSFIKPEYVEHIVSHTMTPNEITVYKNMKNIFNTLQSHINNNRHNVDVVRKFSSYKLALIIYLRQCILCPLLPIATAMIDLFDFNNNSELCNIIKKSFDEADLEEYIENPESASSSRTREAIKIIKKHPNEKIILFSSFRTYLDIFEGILKNSREPLHREIFSIKSEMSSKRRMDIINQFNSEESGPAVLLLTYDIGAEGLNLQGCHNVVLLDYWWNNGKTQQAIARVYRFGQKSNIVNIYFLTSNTGIENIILKKQSDKLTMLSQLETGSLKKGQRVTKINTKEVIAFLNESDNELLIEQISKMSIKSNYIHKNGESSNSN